MKITILAYGSRGDIQPFLALAVGLQKAGHVPCLAAPHRFAEFVEQYNICFAPLPGDPEELSARFNDAGQNPIRTIRAISDYVFEIAPQVSQAAFDACAGADLIIHGFLFTAGGHTIACQLGIPDISIQTFPMFAPTKAFPNVSMSVLPSGWLSYASHWLFDRVFRYGGGSGYRRIWRLDPDIPLPRKLSWPFPPAPDRPRTPLLFAFSSSVIPPPREWQDQPHIHLPGYFFLEEEAYDPPELLVDFLASGEPPVCVTFGSMVNRKMETIRAVLLEALRLTRRRAIILTGWGDWGLSTATAADVLTLDSIPHAWLFPRCKLVIHHGGAGTTAAALRSGIPSMAIPLAGDQPFWAQRVDHLGVGPHSIALKELSVRRLADALLEADSPTYMAGARTLGQALHAEDGVGAAIRLVERYAAPARRLDSTHQP
jgi:sterol 3beta-glucosyltransferase